MKLTFFGAARAVTGSCHCVECNGKKVLIDCGLQQGRDERDNRELDFNPGYIDAVVVTHAHIDHSGRIPLLVKQGFTGNIYCTRLTGQLLSIMLAVNIQQPIAKSAQLRNCKGSSIHTANILAVGVDLTLQQQFLVRFDAKLLHQRRCNVGKAGADKGLARSGADQFAGGALTQHRAHCINHNGFTGTGLTGQHIEARLKTDVRALDDGDILNVQ